MNQLQLNQCSYTVNLRRLPQSSIIELTFQNGTAISLRFNHVNLREIYVGYDAIGRLLNVANGNGDHASFDMVTFAIVASKEYPQFLRIFNSDIDIYLPICRELADALLDIEKYIVNLYN